MGSLTSEQAEKLAIDFLALAQLIEDYRCNNYSSLKLDENQKLKDLHWSILDYSNDLFTFSAALVFDDVDNTLLIMNKITKEIKDTYKHLKNIQIAINIAESVVTLGASILSKNPQAIADSILGLSKNVKEILKCNDFGIM